MRKNVQDIVFVVGITAFFLPFFAIEKVFYAYEQFNLNHPLVMSFLKFAILATLGEIIGLRIKKGVYHEKRFGLMSRAVVWGFLGITIKAAFVIFASGVPMFLEKMGINGVVASMRGEFTMLKLLAAFSISAAMNLIYAPVMMTFHRITDTHILFHGGRFSCLVKRINFIKILKEMDWKVQWNFVFKKTIPFFWIPAHTVTFLLPSEYRVLFAAVLGVVLGVLLAIASIKPKEAV